MVEIGGGCPAKFGHSGGGERFGRKKQGRIEFCTEELMDWAQFIGEGKSLKIIVFLKRFNERYNLI